MMYSRGLYKYHYYTNNTMYSIQSQACVLRAFSQIKERFICSPLHEYSLPAAVFNKYNTLQLYIKITVNSLQNC